MREYHLELGTEETDGRFVRTINEPLLARTNGEAVLIAEEIIRRSLVRQPSMTALLLDERSAFVKAWSLKAQKDVQELKLDLTKQLEPLSIYGSCLGVRGEDTTSFSEHPVNLT